MTTTSKLFWAALAVTVTAIVGAGRGMQAAPQSTDGVPTFTHDVAPILYANCVTCHRPGEIAPMSLISYQEVRPWARAITRKIAEGSMPPWHADAPTGTFSNERKLTVEEKATLEKWAAAGAPEGDPAELKPAPTFADGWRIGKPDAIFEMQEDYPVAASGTIQYEHFYIPTNFTEAKWLKAIEARPGNRAVVHHILVYYEAPPDARASRRRSSRIVRTVASRAGRRQGIGRRATQDSPRVCSRHMRRARTHRCSQRAQPCGWRLAACCICKCITRPTAPQAPIAARSVWCSPKKRQARKCAHRSSSMRGSRFHLAPSITRSRLT